MITDNPTRGINSQLVGFDPVAIGCIPFLIESKKINKLYYGDYNSLGNKNSNMGGLILVHD
jgi:hypothetical protein